MNFEQFNKKVQEQFAKMQQGTLFTANVLGEDVWNTYISNFKDEDNPIFRHPESSTYNCSADRHFLTHYGNVISVGSDYKITHLFDFEVDKDCVFYAPLQALKKLFDDVTIANFFQVDFKRLHNTNYAKVKHRDVQFQLGYKLSIKVYEEEESFGRVEVGKPYIFHHFHTFLDKKFVYFGDSLPSYLSETRAKKQVFERGVKEIPVDAVDTVIELVKNNSVLFGEEYLGKLKDFKKYLLEYEKNPSDVWLWINSTKPNARFRNELIGVLCTDIASGVPLEKACMDWNKRVDPMNYMRASKPITNQQKKDAQLFVENNGYVESFDRRLATLDDVCVEDIKFVSTNSDVRTVSIFDNVPVQSNDTFDVSKLKSVREVSISDFMSEYLPNCKELEVYLENKHRSNLVTLTTSKVKGSKGIFAWNNNFGWTYSGNIARKSMLAQTVESKGGKIDGVLNFRLLWNESLVDNSDLDAHCVLPSGGEIYFSNKRLGNGELDVDITNPDGKVAVENITFSRLQDGVYKFFVHQFSERNSKGFKAELQYGDITCEYSHNKALRRGEKVHVAEVAVKDGNVVDVKHLLKPSNSSKTAWNVDTLKFHKVNLFCLSPNHWSGERVADKHYMFMMEGCYPDEDVRSFHNEHLNTELKAHRKVLDVLAMTTMVKPEKGCLAGLGFNSTIKDEVFVRVSVNGKKQILKVKF